MADPATLGKKPAASSRKRGCKPQSRWDWRGAKSAVITLLLFGVASSLFAADAPEPAPPKRGGTLRLAVEVDPHSMDPAQVFSNEEGMLACFVFNTLLDTNPEGGFIPVLAESLPATSPDALTHTFRLRQGVLFSNGHELVADDVVYSLQRFFDPNSGATSSSFRR